MALNGLTINADIKNYVVEMSKHAKNYREVAQAMPKNSFDASRYTIESRIALNQAGAGASELLRRSRNFAAPGIAASAGLGFFTLPVSAVAAGGLACIAVGAVAVIGAGALGWYIGTQINEAFENWSDTGWSKPKEVKPNKAKEIMEGPFE